VQVIPIAVAGTFEGKHVNVSGAGRRCLDVLSAQPLLKKSGQLGAGRLQRDVYVRQTIEAVVEQPPGRFIEGAFLLRFGGGIGRPKPFEEPAALFGQGSCLPSPRNQIGEGVDIRLEQGQALQSLRLARRQPLVPLLLFVFPFPESRLKSRKESLSSGFVGAFGQQGGRFMGRKGRAFPASPVRTHFEPVRPAVISVLQPAVRSEQAATQHTNQNRRIVVLSCPLVEAAKGTPGLGVIRRQARSHREGNAHPLGLVGQERCVRPRVCVGNGCVPERRSACEACEKVSKDGPHLPPRPDGPNESVGRVRVERLRQRTLLLCIVGRKRHVVEPSGSRFRGRFRAFIHAKPDNGPSLMLKRVQKLSGVLREVHRAGNRIHRFGDNRCLFGTHALGGPLVHRRVIVESLRLQFANIVLVAAGHHVQGGRGSSVVDPPLHVGHGYRPLSKRVDGPGHCVGQKVPARKGLA